MTRVLVIDDDAALLRLMRHALLRAGVAAAVDTAEDGAAGLTLFRTRRPDLVITDLKMPGTDGFDTLRAIRAAEPAAKVIAIAGHYRESAAFLQRARALGASDVLGKPFTPGELTAKAAGCLRL